MLVLLWLICVINLFLPISQVINYLFIFLIVSHLLECMVFYKKIIKSKNNIIKNFLLVMVFGYLHIQKMD
ncbi:MAG TPA: hypothetical protein DEA18_06065 [Dehalococcoidia bacterium]|nr:hypothetical protein [Dehalococcoidia bacterium]